MANSVDNRSSLVSRILVAIAAGTLQPNPVKVGNSALPLTPKTLNSLSTLTAILGSKPLSSSKPMKKNTMAMRGRKVRTVPTPPIMPSATKLARMGSGMVLCANSIRESHIASTIPTIL